MYNHNRYYLASFLCCLLFFNSQWYYSTSFLHSYTVSRLSYSCNKESKKKLVYSSVQPVANTPITTEERKNSTNENDDDDEDNDEVLKTLARLTATTIIQSEKRKNAVGKKVGTQGSSATNWIDEESAYYLKSAFDKVRLLTIKDLEQKMNNKKYSSLKKMNENKILYRRDKVQAISKFLRSLPVPTIIDLSDEFHSELDSCLSTQNLNLLNLNRTDTLHRIGLRLYCFPSGTSLKKPLVNIPVEGGIAYGKLLYGGLKRYRFLNNSNSGPGRPKRRVGERSDIQPTSPIVPGGEIENIPSWVMFGGPQRGYEALDMGPACVLELLIQPKARPISSLYNYQQLPFVTDDSPNNQYENQNDMVLSNLGWRSKDMFSFHKKKSKKASSAPKQTNFLSTDQLSSSSSTTTALIETLPTLKANERNEAFETTFQSKVGGLQPQIQTIIRRILDGRAINNKQAIEEAKELALLGLTPIRGLLLYGKPGTGKTAIAREIARIFQEINDVTAPPKIVSAPELLDKWVGGSERLVRDLFREAEEDLLMSMRGSTDDTTTNNSNYDPSKSRLHVIIIDEIDAVFQKRGSGDDSSEVTRNSVVNMLLAKLDGVKSIPNILLIGMTNRKELLDEALLRPGRLEVHIEIPLPDKDGRREIFQLHFERLRRNNRLSQKLCHSIDGRTTESYQGDHESSSSKISRFMKRCFTKTRQLVLLTSSPSDFIFVDLASDQVSGGFSGADIAGVVRNAGSIALSRLRENGEGVENLLITLEDVKTSIYEMKMKRIR